MSSVLRQSKKMKQLKRNLKGRALIDYKKTLSKKGLTQEQKDIIIGTLLGDASMQATKRTQNSNIKFEQGMKQEAYIQHLYVIFSEWVGTPPLIRHITGGGAADRQSIWFKTYAHPTFNFYKNIFYKRDSLNKQYKTVPKCLHRLLTACSLAYWFMDDGSLNNKT
jgi:hypothetical protein